ncbi:MAG TPA: Sir2 family NAD-dependent protein deacetylase, partial [Bacteroidales bacterium]|nr:Sir2 family NAD-dependent protein deacetylase [Bacteroidales bacterium]
GMSTNAGIPDFRGPDGLYSKLGIENPERIFDIGVFETNPAFYYGFHREFLRQVEELARQIQPGKRENQYPSQISTAARQALYDNLGENIELVLALDEDIRNSREDSWIGNILKERAVKYAILRHVGDRDLQNKIFEIVKNQKEYI